MGLESILGAIGNIFSGKTDVLTALDPFLGGTVGAVRQIVGEFQRDYPTRAPTSSGWQPGVGITPLKSPGGRMLISGGTGLARTRRELERGAAVKQLPQYSIGVTTPGGYQIGGSITRAAPAQLMENGGRGARYVLAQRRVGEWPMRVWPRRMNPLNRRAGRRAIRRVRSMKRLMSKLMRLMPTRPGGGRVSHVPRGYRHVRRRGDLDPFYLEDRLDVRDEAEDLNEEEFFPEDWDPGNSEGDL